MLVHVAASITAHSNKKLKTQKPNTICLEFVLKAQYEMKTL